MKLNDYHWISGSCSQNIKAKNMKNACIAAIKSQLPEKLDGHDKKVLYIDEMKVVKGKMPKYY